MLPRNKRGKRQSEGKIEVEDDRNLPVLARSASALVSSCQRTGSIKKTESVWVISNHDGDSVC